MPYLILSDIHGNLEALDAVLADAEGRYDCVLCLGDVVGYGADPNPITDWMREEATAVVRGNHDRACAGDESLAFFNSAARNSAIWTRRALTDVNRLYLQQLQRGPLRIEEPLGTFMLVHGSPVDEDQYVTEAEEARILLNHLQERVTFFGHTHIQGGFLQGPRGVSRIQPWRPLQIEPDYFYMINPGSVGQPRDGDSRAAYAIYDIEHRAVEFRRAEYNIEGAAAKILAAGLPEGLANRLFDGV